MDDSLRTLERALLAAPGDEGTVHAYLAAVVRSEEDPGPPSASRPLGGRPVVGPLLADEADRVRAIDPALLLVDETGVPWAAVDEPRGRVLFAATVRLRLLDIERWVRDAHAGSPAWNAVQATLDAAFDAALDRLARLIASDEALVAQRAADLVAARLEPAAGERLVRLARELGVDARPRIYRALARGRVPLQDEARDGLRSAIARELPAVRVSAWGALRRGATVADLRKDHASGQPEVRACALEELATRLGATHAHDLVRRALEDPEPLVRRTAVRLVGTAGWASHPRAVDWAMGRLLDRDRGVRVEALRVVRKIPLSPRQIPRLKLIVEASPPGIRPGLERLLELAERRAQPTRRRLADDESE